MTDRNALAGRTLDGFAEIVALEGNADPESWLNLDPGADLAFSLVQNDSEIGEIRTRLRRDNSFGWGVRCRQTEVSFEDGGWTISTHSPSGPRQKTRFLWFSLDVSWTKHERIVEVTDGGEQIAYMAHSADGQRLAAKTIDGRSLPLTRHSLTVLRAEPLSIEKVNGKFTLATTSPVPLEAALLYWHFMLRDYQRTLVLA